MSTPYPRSLVLACTLAAVVLTLFVAMTAPVPFANGALLTSLAQYGEAYAQSWDDFGFMESGGVPMVDVIGKEVKDRQPYSHMPPMGWWPPYFGSRLFGKETAFGFRIFPLLFSALAALTLFGLLIRRVHPLFGLLFVLAFVAMPSTQFWGSLPGVESLSLALCALIAWRWLRYKAHSSTKNRWAFYGLFFFGCLLAWPIYFIAPALCLGELLRPKCDRRIKALLWLYPLGTLAVATVFGHLVWATGDLDYVLNDFLGTIESVAADGVSGKEQEIGERGNFLASIPGMFRQNFGVWASWLAGFGLVISMSQGRWRRDFLTWLACVMTVPGLLNVVLFNGRSSTHSYYYFMLGCGVTLFCLQGARLPAVLIAEARSGASTSMRAVLGASLSFLILVAAIYPQAKATQELLDARTRGLEEQAKMVDLSVKPNTWLYCTSPELNEAMLHSERRWIPPFPSAEFIDRALRAREEGHANFEQVYVVISPEAEKATPEFVKHIEALIAAGRGGIVGPLGFSRVVWLR